MTPLKMQEDFVNFLTKWSFWRAEPWLMLHVGITRFRTCWRAEENLECSPYGYQLIMLIIWKTVRKGVRKLACAAEALLPHSNQTQLKIRQVKKLLPIRW